MHQLGQPPPRVLRQPALTRTGLVLAAGLADSDGELKVGSDVLSRAGVDSARSHQRRFRQCEPAVIPPAARQVAVPGLTLHQEL